MARLDSLLDRVPRTRLALGSQDLAPFATAVALGFAGGIVTAEVLAWWRGYSVLSVLAMAVAAVLSFGAVGLVTKVICGEEVFVYYHHALAVLAAAALVGETSGAPLRPYLDLTALGIGAAFGLVRVGCLMVGCCYGRPCRWGVRYGPDHAATGFPACYVGVRLFPVQAIEAVWAWAVTAVGIVVVLPMAPPGSAFVWYMGMYAAGRFVFEFSRGDTGLGYLLGLSHAQWISCLVVLVLWIASRLGLLPGARWLTIGLSVSAAVLVGVALSGLAAGRRLARRLRTPRHIEELAWILLRLRVEGNGGREPRVYRTSLGVLISAEPVAETERFSTHYAFSLADGLVSPSTAERLARITARLQHDGRPGTLIEGPSGAFHLLC